MDHKNLIRLFNLSVKQIRVFSPTHPMAKESAMKLYQHLKELLEEGDLTLGVIGGKVVINGEGVDLDERLAKEIVKDFKKLGIESLSFSNKLLYDEMKSFLEDMSVRPKELKDIGGFDVIFNKHNYQTIKLNAIRYEVVAEGEVVVKEEELAGEPGAGPGAGPGLGGGEGGKGGGAGLLEEEEPPVLISRLDRIKFLVDTIIEGKEEKLSEYLEDLAEEIENHPKDVAKFVVESSQTISQLTEVANRLGKWLSSDITPTLITQNRNAPRVIDRLASAFDKAIKVKGETDEVKEVGHAIGQTFGGYSDDARIGMMATTYRESEGSTKELIALGKKLFRGKPGKEALDRIEPRLKGRLEEEGMAEGDYEEVLSSIKTIKGLLKKGMVKVSLERLRELEEIEKNFESVLTKKILAETKGLKTEKTVIAHEKERVESIMRQMSAGLVVVDKKGKILMANPEAERLLGVSQEKLIGNELSKCLKSEHVLAWIRKGAKPSPESGVVKDVGVYFGDEDNKNLIRSSTAVVEDQNGKTHGMITVLNNVSQVRKAREDVLSFIMKLIHDLSAPLVSIASILGSVLAKEFGDITAQQQQFVKIAKDSVDRVHRMVRDLLDRHKMKMGKFELIPEPFYLDKLCHETVLTIQTWGKNKKIDVAEDIPEGAFEIIGDQEWLRRVLNNLLSNAMKFTSEGGLITLKLSSLDKFKGVEGTPCFEVTVSDTGLGIKKEDLERIFKEFEQVSLASHPGMSGTGLGLDICRRIIELHGGKIWAESEPGKGSKFHFVIPKEIPKKEKE